MDLSGRRRLGAAAWGLGLAVAAGWVGFRLGGVEAPGVGYAPPVQVAPLETARLQQISVTLHDVVQADQVVAMMDPTLVDAERAVATATLLATREQLGIEQATEERRFAESAEGTRLTRAQLAASIREDEALVATLKERLDIEQGLAARGAVSGLTADDVRWQIEVATARLRANRGALGVAQAAASNAEQRNVDAPGRNDWEMVAATRAVELLEARVEAYDLVAGIDGHVTAIYFAPGAVVPAGLPVLEVRRTATRDVVAYVGSAEAARLVPGESAKVIRPTGETLQATLRSIGGTPQALPLSLWPFPNEPKFAVPVRLELVDAQVSPDEPLTVWL
jgi:multidrug resistance efflux pump